MKKWLNIILIFLVLAILLVGISVLSKIFGGGGCIGCDVPQFEEVKCLPEQRNVDACIEIYQPVCATVNVQCIQAPCDPVLETFENSCKACSNSLVESYVVGGC